MWHYSSNLARDSSLYREVEEHETRTHFLQFKKSIGGDKAKWWWQSGERRFARMYKAGHNEIDELVLTQVCTTSYSRVKGFLFMCLVFPVVGWFLQPIHSGGFPWSCLRCPAHSPTGSITEDPNLIEDLAVQTLVRAYQVRGMHVSMFSYIVQVSAGGVRLTSLAGHV